MSSATFCLQSTITMCLASFSYLTKKNMCTYTSVTGFDSSHLFPFISIWYEIQ